MINWSETDIVLLDMDGTLLDLHFDNYFWREFLPSRYAAHHNCSEQDASSYLMQKSDELHGSLNWYCLDHWSELTGMDILALKTEIAHLIRFRPDTEQFLHFLQQQGKDVALITNAHPKALSLKMQASGLDQYIDNCISSHDFSLAKENAGFWSALQERHPFNYERCVFIDDSLHVLRRASQEGLKRSLQILHPDSTRAASESSEFPGINHFNELMNPGTD